MHYDVIVIGGGAAGLMCAATAGQRGRRVLVIEHANRVGKKILMSGGGRCNFTNLEVGARNYLSANPHFCKSALARYTPAHFIGLVERHGIAWHEKELGQLFCDESSKQIVRLLLDECAAAAVQIAVNCSVEQVERGADGFRLRTSALGELSCGSLVVASGGLSIPSLGASGYGYQLARQFGHTVLPTRAGLVPLTLSGAPLDDFAPLAGIALPVETRANGQAFRAGLLFTHRGLSGPAILQISSYWQPKDELRVDWLPNLDALDYLSEQQHTHPNAELRTALAGILPSRFAQRLCERWLPSRPLKQFRMQELKELAARLHDWPIVASGTEGYRTAEVTLGGVDTHELSSATMASRKVPDLYFVGEVVDVTGWLGGYNFQWAWASGHAAGEVV
ncbi:NAD(P)/FAD-dependent oxidoreductase [Solimonas variicoloris]|uniref:NAD(P)/FAD-dependent oxidoreductase n=1 Tax=Solimonas variicoloris TaxID=254408 RepID=UPI000364F80F|nr:NAD(P)/FAD-dependent oxidoreductase [Solimonas variicoloris]